MNLSLNFRIMSSFWLYNVRRNRILKIFVHLDSPMCWLCFHTYLAHSSRTKLLQIIFFRRAIKFAPRPPPTNQRPHYLLMVGQSQVRVIRIFFSTQPQPEINWDWRYLFLGGVVVVVVCLSVYQTLSNCI